MEQRIKVWSRAIRLFHWGLVASFATAWLTGDEVMSIHEWAGYAAAALIAFRVALGLFGSGYARFGQFLHGPAVTMDYAADVAFNREARHLGHNPLGGLMVVALMAAMAGLAFTGWLQTTDAYWGVEWVEDAHEIIANTMLGMIALHVAGVLLASFRHEENLVLAMITGRKRAPEDGDVA
jgi:cytochrome b